MGSLIRIVNDEIALVNGPTVSHLPSQWVTINAIS